MASRRKYRIMWLRWLKQYTRFSNRELMNTFKSWGRSIPYEQLTANNYKLEIKTALNTQLMFDTYRKIYTDIGLKHGNRVGKTINQQLKNFTSSRFTTQFLIDIEKFLQINGINRVTTIQSTYFDEIVKLIEVRLAEGMDIEQLQREIRKIVNSPSFYRSHALRIARTETTAAANFGATRASTVSGFVMQKEWISALDARTRRTPPDKFDHREMNGVRVGEKEAFNVDGEELMYPGDPNGSAGNVINCRCSVAIVPARDSNGNLIPIS